jgi:uncharacterized phage-associated protein
MSVNDKATIHDFDQYIQQFLKPTQGSLGETQRHKLLYDVYVLGSARHGVMPFESVCKAWKAGPVFPAIRWNAIQDAQQRPDYRVPDYRRLTWEQREMCDFIGYMLGGTFGWALSQRSHEFAEWQQARLRGENVTITPRDIANALQAEVGNDGRIIAKDELRCCEVADYLSSGRALVAPPQTEGR